MSNIGSFARSEGWLARMECPVALCPFSLLRQRVALLPPPKTPDSNRQTPEHPKHENAEKSKLNGLIQYSAFSISLEEEEEEVVGSANFYFS